MSKNVTLQVQPIKVKLIFEFMACMFLHFHNKGFESA